jgi:signal transduction histidine kinase
MPSEDPGEDTRVFGDAGWRPSGPPWHSGWGRRSRPPRWLPVVISAVVQVISVAIAVHGAHPLVIIAALAAFGASGLLLLSSRAPGPAVAAIAALCTPGIALNGGPPLAAAPLVFAVVIAVHAGERVWVWSSLGGIALIGGIGGYLLVDSRFVSMRVLIVVIVLCLVVALAEGARSRRSRYRAASRAVAARRQSAAEAERMRIARELHDVLAHSLSQISVQAGVGLHLFDAEPERAREALASIKQASGRALDEVRGVLGVLRADGEEAARAPQPDLTAIPELVRTTREAGVHVTVLDGLSEQVPSSVQFVMYRVVQEALTNVVKHSRARVATVRLSEGVDGWMVEVIDPGPKTPAASDLPGRGIVGMRERVQLLGGRVTTEQAGVGFRVVAELPRQRSGTTSSQPPDEQTSS